MSDSENALDALSREIKKDPNKHYRFVRQESANFSMKKAKGYETVGSQDPEIKGTILEKHKDASGHVSIGNLVLMRTSQEQFAKNRKVVEDRNDRIRRSIKERYLQGGEDLKRELGSKHKGIKLIHEESE